MTQIEIRGATSNNLKSVNLDLPRGRLVVFVGVSGSGKSSLVFDTIAAEAGFQVNETFPPFARNRLPKWTRPEVTRIAGLSPVVVVDQRRIGGNSRSTVGTITDTWTYLRLLFSRLSTPHVGESSHFLFNDPAGMCPGCSGLGEVIAAAVDRFLDLDRSLAEGAILVPGFGYGGYWHDQYADLVTVDARVPLREWTPQQRHVLLHGGPASAQLGSKPGKDFEGVVERFERIYLRATGEVSDRKREVIERFTRSQPCPQCDGERLTLAARSATVAGKTITELARVEISQLGGFLAGIKAPEVAPVLRALTARLEALETIGLGYLSLDRPTPTLSGGESQRIKTVTHLGSSLVEMVYIFDEPTMGLRPHDVASMIALLRQLRDKGNSVLVVEHDPEVMAEADHLVELGPDAGRHGGHLVFQGSYQQLRAAETATSAALRTQQPMNLSPRTPTGHLVITEATRNNLRTLTVRIPRGVLTVLTGVAGSGKSSLAAELVDQHGATVVDQRPVSTNRRSTPVTYTGIGTAIRQLFASCNRVSAALFSPNSAGGCPACGGAGVTYTDLAFLEGQQTRCETCQGRRFTAEVLRFTVAGLTIADVDALTVDEALVQLDTPAVRDGLHQLAAVGLGYLRLGQPLSTLSGGEAQRVKIAKQLSAAEPRSGVYVLDEPTTGLHPRDTDTLLRVVDTLIQHGHTAVVIEHNLDVIRRADWVIDLGAGSGAARRPGLVSGSRPPTPVRPYR